MKIFLTILLLFSINLFSDEFNDQTSATWIDLYKKDTTNETHPTISEVLFNGKYISLTDNTVWEVHPGYVNLADAWDDKFIRYPKSWKAHRKTQYKTDKHSIAYSWIPVGEYFKLGGRLMITTREGWRIRTYEVETMKRVYIDWFTFCEWPIYEN